METILDTASTWFLEHFIQRPNGELRILLAEGRQSDEAQKVEIEPGNFIGPAFEVTVTEHSRVAEVVFSDPLGFFTHRESFDSVDPDREMERGGSYIREVTSSSLRSYASKATGILETWYGEVREYHIWSEDQVLQVFCTEPPEVAIVPGVPDFSIERVSTWVRATAS